MYGLFLTSLTADFSKKLAGRCKELVQPSFDNERKKLILDLACPIRELFSPPPDSQGQTSSVRFQLQDWGLTVLTV